MKKIINVNFVSASLISIMFFLIIGMGVIIQTQNESIDDLKGYNDYW